MKLRVLAHAFLALAAVYSLSSCVISGFIRVPREQPFDESAFAAYGGPGTATVSGRVAVICDGETHFGDGSTISLVPVTAYTTEMVNRELGKGAPLFPADRRLKKYVRHTKSDSNGNFIFQQVPAGDYYLAGIAEWLPSGSEDYTWQWGCERITITEGQFLNILVSHNPAIPGSFIGPSSSWTAE